MKCIAFVVILAFAAVNGHIIAPWPLAYNSWAYGPHISLSQPHISLSQGVAGLPIQLASSVAAVNALAPGATLVGGATVLGAPALVQAPGAVLQSPGSLAVHAPAAAVVAPGVVAAVPSASYVATTRGAQHVAPLPGHIESVSSTNLQPAPGTL